MLMHFNRPITYCLHVLKRSFVQYDTTHCDQCTIVCVHYLLYHNSYLIYCHHHHAVSLMKVNYMLFAAPQRSSTYRAARLLHCVTCHCLIFHKCSGHVTAHTQLSQQQVAGCSKYCISSHNWKQKQSVIS